MAKARRVKNIQSFLYGYHAWSLPCRHIEQPKTQYSDSKIYARSHIDSTLNHSKVSNCQQIFGTKSNHSFTCCFLACGTWHIQKLIQLISNTNWCTTFSVLKTKIVRDWNPNKLSTIFNRQENSIKNSHCHNTKHQLDHQTSDDAYFWGSSSTISKQDKKRII